MAPADQLFDQGYMTEADVVKGTSAPAGRCAYNLLRADMLRTCPSATEGSTERDPERRVIRSGIRPRTGPSFRSARLRTWKPRTSPRRCPTPRGEPK